MVWTPSPKRRPSWILPAIVAAIIVAGTLGGLYAAGVGPFYRPAKTGPVTFDQARTAGDSASQAYGGGGWSLVGAAAVLPRADTAIPLATIHVALASTLANCSGQWLASGSLLVVPGFKGNVSAGTSPFWGLLYRNSSGGLLVMTVVDGSASALLSLPGGTTCTTFASLLGALSSSLKDSPAIAASVAASGGASFLSAHPNATVAMGIVGGFSAFSFLPGLTRTVWQVNYTLCGTATVSGSVEATFNATVDAQTGSVVYSHAGTETCSNLTGFATPGATPIPFSPPPSNLPAAVSTAITRST